jgi:phenylacetic acid degradation operon negative regulatory protein
MLVTIFGDLAQDAEDRIDGTLLTQLTDGMGIKPEAVRVALHRLRNDDWITSLKSGRTASHALTPHARRESQMVSDIIYAPVTELTRDWQVAITETNDAAQKDQMLSAGFAQVSARLYVASGLARAPESVLVLRGERAPKWLESQVIPEDLTLQFDELITVLQQVDRALVETPPNPLDTAILRSLIVHHWRRLALRHPFLPPNLTGKDWSGHVCRNMVVRELAKLPRPSLMDLRA